MNLLSKSIYAAAFLVIVGTSCSEAPQGDKATVSEKQETAASAKGQTFVVDTTLSKVRFIGNGVGKNHPGNFRLSSGSLSVVDNAVTAGEFSINIQSMQVEEEGDMFQNKLKPHLLNADFFDAEKYPAATFQITEVKPYTATTADSSVVEGANATVSGNFTLKDVTKNISFPAKIDVTENGVSAVANFNIDRTQWNMKYGNDKGLGDKFISETVNIQLNLQAKK